MKNMKKGFTIIEMVIVIAIIGILAAVMVPTYSSVVEKANKSAAMQECRNAMTEWLAEVDYKNGSPEDNSVYFVANKGGENYVYTYVNGEMKPVEVTFTTSTIGNIVLADKSTDVVKIAKDNGTTTAYYTVKGEESAVIVYEKLATPIYTYTAATGEGEAAVAASWTQVSDVETTLFLAAN